MSKSPSVKYAEAVYNGDRPDIKVLYNDGKNITHIRHLCSSITVSGDIAQAYRKVDLDLMNTINGLTQGFAIDLAHEIRVIVGKAEIFRGTLEVYNVDDKGGASAVAYDYNFLLTKNKDTAKFTNKKASEVIRELCVKYGIPIGKLPDTGYVIPTLHFRPERTIYDMMVIALTESEKKNGRKFSLVNQWGKLYLLERKEAIKRVVLENQRTLLSASYAKSNENRMTSVKVVGNTDAVPVGGTATNASSVKKFGMRQHYEVVNDATNEAAVNAMARQLLTEYDKTEEEFNITALGLYDVISGTAIVVNERMSNMYGAFYVQQDTHTFDASGLHTMALKLSRTLDIPREDYEAPQENTSATGGSGSSTAVIGKAKVTDLVRKWEPTVRKYAKEFNVESHVELLLAVMMQESGGRVVDLMQSSESLNLGRNKLTQDASIKQGVKYFAEGLRKAKGNIKVALQGYNCAKRS